VSHRRFSELTIEEQEGELRLSKEILEDRLGRRIETFAYPYGDRGADLRGLSTIMKRTGYRAACLFGDGPNHWPFPDPYLLNRVAMGPDTDLGVELETP
jgi:peptidoglycan/xylan/chitin deacetylase (PgdA/CDA1 family)